MPEKKDDKKALEVPVFFCPHCGEILSEELIRFIIKSNYSQTSKGYWSDEEARSVQAARAKAIQLFEKGVKARKEQARKRALERKNGGSAEEQKPELSPDKIEWKRELCRRMHEARKRNSQKRRDDGSSEGGRHHIDAKVRNIIQGIYIKYIGLFSTSPSGVVAFLGMKGMPTIYFNTKEELADALLTRGVFRGKEWSVRSYTMDDGTVLYGISVIVVSKERRLTRLYAIAAHVDAAGLQNPNLSSANQ